MYKLKLNLLNDNDISGENTEAGIDFYIQPVDLDNPHGACTVDIFNTSIDNLDDAYLESFLCETLFEALDTLSKVTKP